MNKMGKVLRGTPNQHSESLCVNCRAAHIVTGLAESSERVHCRALGGNAGPPIISQPVLNCNTFDDKRTPSRWDMEQIAWVLVTNKTGKAIGFVSAEDFRKSQVGFGQPTPTIGF